MIVIIINSNSQYKYTHATTGHNTHTTGHNTYDDNNQSNTVYCVLLYVHTT